VTRHSGRSDALANRPALLAALGICRHAVIQEPLERQSDFNADAELISNPHHRQKKALHLAPDYR
jgi:hypothetical protein